MIKLFLITILIFSINVSHAKGGGHASTSHATMAHASGASHMMAHGSSHKPDKLTGRKLTKEESITVFVTFFTFLIIAVVSMAWSD